MAILRVCLLFGQDYRRSPMYGDDSEEAVRFPMVVKVWTCPEMVASMV